jgi:hypothetical protein
MALLPRFATPGNIADANADAWSATVTTFFEDVATFEHFYDPTKVDTPAEAVAAPVVWPAFPASLPGPFAERLEMADTERGTQDEYCEWAVERDDAGKITRVTFTTEVPEYFEHLFETDQAALLAFYRDFVSPEVELADLTAEDGSYLPRNQWNDPPRGRPAHLRQGSNTLPAAVTLAAQATVLRERNGIPVTHPQSLVVCSQLGVPLRGSDPQIASAINAAVASGASVTLSDPVGLYIDGLITGGIEAPDGVDPASFWTIERGSPTHALRAAFEVPTNHGYVVGDLKIDGRSIEFGGQLAVRVRVRIDAVVKVGIEPPPRLPCKPAP